MDERQLLAAVEDANLQALKRALDSGVDVNAPVSASTLLHRAVMARDAAMVAFLCARGADISARDGDEETVFGYCGSEPCDAMTRFLIDTWIAKHGCKAQLTIRLFKALHKADHKQVAELVERGVDLNDCGWRRETPLMFATTHGSLESMRQLLDLGASSSAACPLGDTPLHLAADTGYVNAVIALLQAGADPNATTDIGSTPLKCAGKRAKIVALLEAHGAH